MSSRRSPLSLVTLIVGTVITAGSAIAAYFFADSIAVLAALLIAMIGAVITLVLDQRVKLAELENLATERNTAALLEAEIDRLARVDGTFRTKYAELQSEMADLARGIYRIRTLTSVYQDDIRTIDRLRAGEVLLSTCPITPSSGAEAIRQVTDPAYTESIRAHVDAAERGVRVTRIYLLRDLQLFLHAALARHLVELEQSGVDVRVILRDETILDGQFDFLVFGSDKVSVGVAEPGAGTVSGAIVYTDPTTVQSYVEEYAKLRVMSTSASRLLAMHGAATSG